VAAFALDEGESLGALLAPGPPSPICEHQIVDDRGFVWLAEDDFLLHFAADVPPTKAKVMHAVQQPLTTSAFDDVIATSGWKALPSWYLVAGNDEAIPPPAEHIFADRMGAATVVVPASHVAMVSHANDVVQLIQMAVEACSVTT
jgi:hypothetical protein